MYSILRTLGVFTAAIGAVSAYTNLASYYGTKYKLNRLENRCGPDYANEVFERDLDSYRSGRFVTNLFGGIGIKLLDEKRRS